MQASGDGEATAVSGGMREEPESWVLRRALRAVGVKGKMAAVRSPH